MVQKDDANKVQGNKTWYEVIMSFYWGIKKVFLMTLGKVGTYEEALKGLLTALLLTYLSKFH